MMEPLCYLIRRSRVEGYRMDNAQRSPMLCLLSSRPLDTCCAMSMLSIYTPDSLAH